MNEIDRRALLLSSGALAAVTPADGRAGRWLGMASPATAAGGEAPPRSEPGGAVTVTGLFGSLAQAVVPVGTDLVHTSGHSRRGVGAARYSVGPVGETVPLSRHSTMTANGRPVTLAEPSPTVDMFGAIPDGVTDSLPAFQAGVDYVAERGPGILEVPGVGSYRWSGGLEIRHNVTLQGHAGLEGGGGFIRVEGNAFLTCDHGYVTFSMNRIGAGGLKPLTLDFFSTRHGAVLSFASIENCYFANFRDWDGLVLGVHVYNNNFSNFRRIKLGGSDNDFLLNFANYDPSNPDADTPEVFWMFQAMGATGFEHNYISCLKSAAHDPIVLAWGICNQVRCVHNQLDGGTAHTFRISDATQSMVAYDNRLNSLASWSRQGYVPIHVISCNDTIIRDCKIGSLEPGAPFVKFEGRVDRVLVSDNITNKKVDESEHDFVSEAIGRFEVRGYGVPRIFAPKDGGQVQPVHFDRLLTNAGGTANPQHVYVDMENVKSGDVIECCHADPSRRWIILDRRRTVALFDSDRDGDSSFFRFVSLADRHLTLDIARRATARR